MDVFRALATVPPGTVMPSVTVRFVHGDQLTTDIAELAPGTVLPRHQNVNEPMGIALQGSATMDSQGQQQVLTPSCTYSFPSGVPHQVTAGPDGAAFTECFSPTCSDWAELPGAEAPAVSWPGTP